MAGDVVWNGVEIENKGPDSMSVSMSESVVSKAIDGGDGFWII